MVSEPAEAPTLELEDQAPPESQTEVADTPELELEPVDAAEPEVEAAPEPEQPLTRAEVQKMLEDERQKIREDAVREARAREQRERQRLNGLREKEQKRQQEEDAEATEIVQAQLVRLGLTEADPNQVKPLLDRYASKRQGQWTARYDADLAEGARAAAADVMGVDFDEDLSDGAERFRKGLSTYASHMFEQGKQALIQSGDYIHKDDLPKHVDAEIARRKPEQKPVKRVEEAQKGGENRGSLAYWDTRIAHEGEDGYPVLSPADWADYRKVRRQNGLD
jgi:hypothetical protein